MNRVAEIKSEIETHRLRIRELNAELEAELRNVSRETGRSLFDLLEEFAEPPEPKLSDPRPLYCAKCNGHRMHIVVEDRDEATDTVRQYQHCQDCKCKSLAPGIHCPQCGKTKFKTKFTRHTGDRTFRSKLCRGCERRFRTVEKLIASA